MNKTFRFKKTISSSCKGDISFTVVNSLISTHNTNFYGLKIGLKYELYVYIFYTNTTSTFIRNLNDKLVLLQHFIRNQA